MVIELASQRANALLTVAAAVLLLVSAGCATVQQPQRDNLASDDGQIRDCARSFKELDASYLHPDATLVHRPGYSSAFPLLDEGY